MSKQKDIAVDHKATNGKRKKTGFALRLTFAILFTVAAIMIVVVGIFMYMDLHRDTFIPWYRDSTGYNYNLEENIQNDGTIELISDKPYDNWVSIRITGDLDARVCYRVHYKDDTNEYDEYDFDFYGFSTKENATAKTVTFKNYNGEAITLSYANWSSYLFFLESHGWLDGDMTALILFVALFAILAVLAILQFIGAFAGRKHKWGNNICIVLGAITSPSMLGIMSIVGGVRGKKYLQSQEPEQPQDVQDETAITTIAPPDIPTEQQTAPAASAKPAACTAQPPAEYIKPKLSPKAQRAMMITMIVSYALLLVFGILCAAQVLGSMFAGMGICEAISSDAYSIVIGMMMLVGVPSIGYYFATVAPTKLSKKVKLIAAAITTVLMLALIATAYIVIYFVEVKGLTINCYLEGSDTWFVPLSVAFAPLGIMICYLLTLFRINPEKIRTTKPAESGDGLFAIIKHIFAMLIYGIMKLVKGILSFKEKQPEIFILIATILLTWLSFFTAFVFAIICIAVLVGVIVMYFAGVMSLYTPSAGNANGAPSPTDEYYKQDEYTYVDSHGYTQTVYTDRDGKEARDVGGRYVGEISGDGSEKNFTHAGTSTHNDDE